MYGENLRLSVMSIMAALASEKQWMRLVRDGRKAYGKLIDYYISDSSLDESSGRSDSRTGTVKYIAERLGEKPATVNKWFRQIYQDIFDLNEEHPELFVNPGEQLCSFEYSSPGNGGGFWFNLGVKSIPRVGELFSFRFVSPLEKFPDFVVKEVTHRFERGKMEVEVFLRPKCYSGGIYRDLLIDKARFMGYMDILDLGRLDYAIDDKLMDIFRGSQSDFI